MIGGSPTIDRSREMDEKSWWELWNTSYRAKDDNDLISTELFTRAAAIVNQVTQGERSRILEVGCCTGTLSRMLVFASYHGLDISAAAVEIARWNSACNAPPAGANRPKYEVSGFCERAPPASKFDVVVCVDAIACIRDQSLAMRNMGKSLCSGGRLVLTTVNRFVYECIRRSATVKLENGSVSRWLSRSELNTLVSNAGFKIEKSHTIMLRGNMGVLRIINSPRVNYSMGSRVSNVLQRLKEDIGLGQYSVVVARKD